MAELESEDIEMLKGLLSCMLKTVDWILDKQWFAQPNAPFVFPLTELGSLTTANLMEKVKGLQNLAYQLGLEECK